MPPPFPVTYSEKIDWGTPANDFRDRPYCSVSIHGGNLRRVDCWALLDTGADDLLLNTAAAHYLKINLRKCALIDVETASGAILRLPSRQLDVTIRNVPFRTTVIFGIAGTPLIGHRVISKAMEFGLDTDGWLYNKRP